eukprot:symbB.v1.2.018328.t1/scaffold1417.1/size119926/2
MARWARARKAAEVKPVETLPPVERQRCPICLEDGDSQWVVLPCQHALCRECLVNYVESLVNQGKVAAEQLACPLPECRSPVPTDVLQAQLHAPELFQRLLDFQAQRFVPEPDDGERLLNCPTPGCVKMLVPVSLVEQKADVNCPQCKQSFCTACTQPAHLGTCEDAELQRMDPQLREMIKKENWKRCPVCRHLCERESGCNFMTCPSEQCKGETYFCYLCGELLTSSDHAAHYEGFEGAIGLRGPFGSVCMNKREPDTSLPSQPPPPTLSVVPGEEGAIALRITFGDHRSEPPTIYYRIWLAVAGSKEVRRLSAPARQPFYDAPKSVPKYIRYQASVMPINVNGAGPISLPSEVVHFHPRELSKDTAAILPAPARNKRWTLADLVRGNPPGPAGMPPVKVTHGLMQGAVFVPKQPSGDPTASARRPSAGRLFVAAEQTAGGYAQTVRRPSLLAYAGYEDRMRRSSCSNISDVMVPKAVKSIRSQVMVSRDSDSADADANAISRARGRRPSVVEATFQNSSQVS